MAVFYDTHAHLDYPDFQPDLEESLRRAELAGIRKIISIGTDLESSRQSIRLAEQFPAVFAAVGWHPSNAQRAPEDIRAELRELGNHPKVVALGETGLDYHHLPSEKPGFSVADDDVYKRKQAQLFHQHLGVAAELGLNCVIHQRDALQDTLTQMQQFKTRVRGVFHCFVDGVPALHQIIECGSLVSFTGIVTFKNAQTVRESLGAAPSGHFMFETDCPYLAPMPYRGKRCEPAYVKEIAELAASVRNCSLEELSAATCATAHGFFPKLGPLGVLAT